MTGGAGAYPATCVFQRHAEFESNIQNGRRLTVVRIRKSRGIEFDSFVLIQKCYFWHIIGAKYDPVPNTEPL